MYKALAHPEKNGYVQPVTVKERLAHVAAAKRQLDARIPWLADSMDNDLKHAFGDRNNSEFVIGADGNIAIARSWSNPETLRADLEKMVGKSKTTTSPSDLGLKPAAAKRQKIARGIVPRVERPQGSALIAKPVSNKSKETPQPLYAKLRVEAERGVITDDGEGTMYLGFHLDPIHTVHWNNLAEPLQWSIETPDGVTLSKSKGVAPKVEAEADIDPREFLIDVKLDGDVPKKPMVLTVSYFACDDEEGWCRAVEQKYQIQFATDRDAGRVQAGGGRRGGGGGAERGGARGERGAGRPGGGGRPDPAQMMERMDANGDGKISSDEARGPMRERISQWDKDGDGALSKEELTAGFGSRR